MDVLYKTYPSQNKQYTWAVSAPYTRKLQFGIWLLENSNKKPVHQKCIEFFLIEVCKYLNGLSPDIMNTIFKLKQNTYNLRKFHALESQIRRTKKFCLDIAHRVSQLWKNVPEELRNSVSLLIFKESIKKVPLISCSCHRCKTYTNHVGYI